MLIIIALIVAVICGQTTAQNVTEFELIKEQIASHINQNQNQSLTRYMTFGKVYDVPNLDSAIAFIHLNKQYQQNATGLIKPSSFLDAAFIGASVNDVVADSISRSVIDRYLLLLLVIDSSVPCMFSDRAHQSIMQIAELFPNIVIALLDQSLHHLNGDKMYDKFNQIRRVRSIRIPLSTSIHSNNSLSDRLNATQSQSLNASSELITSPSSKQSNLNLSSESSLPFNHTSSATISDLLNTSFETNASSSDAAGEATPYTSLTTMIRNAFESIRMWMNEDSVYRPDYKRQTDSISLLVNRRVIIQGVPSLMLFTLKDGWLLDQLIDDQLPTVRRLSHRLTQITGIEPVSSDTESMSESLSATELSVNTTMRSDQPTLPWAMFGMLGFTISQQLQWLIELFATIVQQPGLLFAAYAVGTVHLLQILRHRLDALEVNLIAQQHAGM